MFDKTFFKFALGLAVIILFGVGTLYIAGYWSDGSESDQTAAVR
ncbi:MAG: hypothetical protein AAB450_01255 [Patescibacteria group bacterium]